MVRLEDIRVGDCLYYLAKDGTVMEVDVFSSPRSETGFALNRAGENTGYVLTEGMLKHMYWTPEEVKQLTLF